MSKNKFSPGLVSITFRQLSWQEVLQLCVRGGADSIEWGGDIHVPHEELTTAMEVGKATTDAGLKVACYGSYYRLLFSRFEGLGFREVLNSAKALGAPVIRIWAGKKGSADFSPEEYAEMVKEAHEVATMAASEGIRVTLEFHRNTQTDSARETLRFLKDINHPNINTLWQPSVGLTDQERMAELQMVLPQFEHLHVFYWEPLSDRRPLAEGKERWLPFLREVRAAGKAGPALIEFVRDGQPEQWIEDIAALKSWIEIVETETIPKN